MDKQEDLSILHGTFEKLIPQSQYTWVQASISVIKDILTAHTNQKLYVSFNGGKDATVVLFLTHFALKQLGCSDPIKCIYFEESDPFTEMESFMGKMIQLLGLKVFRMKSKKYAAELTKFSEETCFQWIVMGSRRDDPGCANLGSLAVSDVDKGYPKFTRVNPIIEWSCSSVWKFIKDFGIPYCQLYNEGYTSLGAKHNTTKNEALYDPMSQSYLPAFQAKDEVERKNRE